TAAIAHPRVDERSLEGELATHAPGDPMRDLSDLVGPTKGHIGALEAARALAEDVAGTVDQDVGDFRIVEQRLKRSEAEQLGAHRIDLRLADGHACRDSHTFAKERSPRGLGVCGQQSRGIDADRDLRTDARDERRVGQATARSSTSTARRVGARAAKASSARYAS